VDDGVKESLEINAFREAVGSNKQPLHRGAHVVDASAAFVRGKYSSHRLDAEMRKSLAQSLRDVFRSGDEAAEYDGIGSLGDQRFKELNDGG
jgi:hypothetical protein